MLSREMMLFVEVELLCLIIVFIMIHNLWKTHREAYDDFYFFMCTGALEVILLSDIANCFLEGRPERWATGLLYLVNAIFFISTGIAAYAWLTYTDFTISNNPGQVNNRKVMLNIPCAFLAVITICSIKTSWIFYIDEANIYHRGSFHLVQQLIVMLYFSCALIYAIVAYFTAATSAHRSLCKKMVGYSCVPIIGTLLQIIFPDMVLAWPVCCIGMLVVFTQLQNSQIALDTLTGLNNRARLFHYINESCSKITNEDVMSCMMIDIDDFQHLNNRYGHAVGDEVLKVVADIVKESCGRLKGSHFLARYSSSVFAIVSIDSNMDSTFELKASIEENINKYNDDTTNSFRLNITTAVVEYDMYAMNTDNLIAMADETLAEAVTEKKLLKKANKKSEDLIK